MKHLKILLPAVAIGFGLSSIPALAADSCTTQAAAAQPVVVVDPFLAMQAQMARMNMEMNQIMQAAFAAPHDAGQAGFSSVDMETAPKEYRITMHAPGADEKNIKFSVSDRMLTIRSEENQVQKTGTGDAHATSSFTQMMSLPVDADADHIQTSYKDGEYTVTIPRKTDGATPTSGKPVQGQPI